MTRVALYARYSSDRQNERSIADQVAILTRHADARGWIVSGVFTDAAISGSAMANRPGLLNAIASAERGEFDLLLVEDEDRIARNLEHLAHVANRLEDMGAAIATLGSDRVEGMMVAFKGGMAQDFLRNLSAKTKRGMASNAEKGLATGSRLFGYRSAPGGALTIVEEEAEVVRHIFGLYAHGGLTCREIAHVLNTDGVPAVRGGQWSASTISGSRTRANGILQTELYRGEKVYNRVEMRKDRRTGKRVTICKPAKEHIRVPVPDLRIVDQDLWDAVHARKAARMTKDPSERAKLVRRPHLLSGLTKCGRCGAAYTSLSQGRMTCAGYRAKGESGCTNRRQVQRSHIEQRVLQGLRTRLLAPEAVAAYVRAYHAEWERRTAQVRDQRQPLERKLAEVGRATARCVDAIVTGAAPATVMGEKLRTLEAQKAELTAAIAALDATPEPPVRLHPRAAEAYARQIEDLQTRLAEAARDFGSLPSERNLLDAARGLIDRVDIEPEYDEPRSPVRITLHGQLARFMETSSSPSPQWGSAMVAGGGIEPPTCGL